MPQARLPNYPPHSQERKCTDTSYFVDKFSILPYLLKESRTEGLRCALVLLWYHVETPQQNSPDSVMELDDMIQIHTQN